MRKYCLLLLLLVHYTVFAQEKILQQKVSVDFRNITMYDALMQIEGKAGFYFSYDNQFIKNQKKISFAATDKPVKEVLDMILDREYYYIVNHNKIVIRKKETEYLTIQGQFFDQADQAPVEYVTVYDPLHKIGAMSDHQGQFSIKVPVTGDVKLTASRVSYYDTSFTVNTGNNVFLKMGLSANVKTEEAVTVRSIERHWLAKTVIGTRQRVNSLNLKNYFYERKFQAGFWPGLGTKSALKGQQENKISFNVLGGYAAQVDAFELGGLFNIVQKHVRSVQIGGLFNVVGGSVTGVQIGGLSNYVAGDVKGLQIGGLSNRTTPTLPLIKNVTALQGGSFADSSKTRTTGLQIGGLYNHTQLFDGFQIAGLFNNAMEVNAGMQLSGLVNYTPRFKKGLQLTGLANIARQLDKGAQVSGLVNYARKINGFQLGVLNLADTLKGVAIGPFNYSRNGKHALSLSVQENRQVNIAYKSGSYALYNILQAGWLNSDITGGHFLFGYGLGSEWKLKGKLRMAAELINLHYTPADNFDTDYSNVILQPLFIYQVGKKLQVYAGPRLQYQLPVQKDDPAYFSNFSRNMLPLSQGKKDALHLGFSAGINIF